MRPVRGAVMIGGRRRKVDQHDLLNQRGGVNRRGCSYWAMPKLPTADCDHLNQNQEQTIDFLR